MVIIRLSGGLGNQMFQYAFGLRLRSLGREVYFDDVSGYEHQEETGVRRPVQLGDVFGINYPRADGRELRRLRDARMDLPSRLRRKLLGRRSRERRDEDFIYDPSLLAMDEVYFSGCFQCAEYFLPIEEEVRRAFSFPGTAPGMTAALRGKGEALREQNAVAVHFRFGDYLDKPGTYGGITTRAYYEKAFSLMAESADVSGATQFYIFTNDRVRAEDALRQMRLPENASFTVCADRDETHGYLDLFLMQCCRRHIIANSSFSWWGAWLAASDCVVAPALWIHCPDGTDAARTGLFTDNMIRVNADGQIVRCPLTLWRECAPEEPLISVIVAAYNIERYLPRALDSLRRQTWRRLDVIVVDDGSTDGTPEIADRYARMDGRFRALHKANGGLSDARNAGLALAEGAYIGYLDGDDWCEPEMYEAMVRACLLTGAEVSTVQYRQVREDAIRDASRDAAQEAPQGPSCGQTRDIDRILSESVLLDRQAALRRYLEPGRQTIFNSVWSKLFRRDIAEGICFQTGRNSEDIVYTGRTLCRVSRCAVLQEPLYNYLLDRSGSIMNRGLGERRLRDEMPNWKEQIACFRENGLPDIADRAAYMYYRRLLAYDLEFRREKGLLDYALRLEETARREEQEIRRIYAASYVRRGDRRRMALFLRSPGRYALWAGVYEKTIVPLKNLLAGVVRREPRCL